MSSVLAPLMLVVAMALIFAGFPVAFTLGGVAVLFAALGTATGAFEPALLFALPERIFGIMSNYVLLAVPFFIAMGSVLERSRLAEDLLTTIGHLFGRLRGGLALGVVLVGTLLAAATGVVGASVVAMGVISLPVMLRYGYSAPLATGVITASGTLGQIIPPSVVLVVLADQMGISVGELFVGALLPGLLLAGTFALYVAGVSLFRPAAAPALPEAELAAARSGLVRRLLSVLLPPLALVLVVLGSIFAGVATPTEAGALGAVGAALLAALRGRLSLRVLTDSARETSRLTGMVVFLLLGATAFALVLRGLDGDLWIEGLLTGLPGGVWGFLLFANLAIFLLGFFLDFFEIAFVLVPLLVPAAQRLGIDPVWLGVMIAMNLQTSFLTPPFGFSLFYLRGVCPASVPTTALYRGVVPFIVLQLAALAAVIAFPQLVSALR
jgi:tripartite ATP-independent transporter DctM subunit